MKVMCMCGHTHTKRDDNVVDPVCDEWVEEDEQGCHCTSFQKRDLGKIIEELIEEYDSTLRRLR